MVRIPIATWENRMDSLKLAIDSIRGRTLGIDREVTIATSLAFLEHFGTKQFEFFRDCFRDDRLQYNRPSEQELPEFYAAYELLYPIDDFVYKSILGQISRDFRVFQQAQEQRIAGLGNQTPYSLPALELTDQLAWEAIQRIQVPLGLQHRQGVLGVVLEQDVQPTVLTYLNRITNARIMPYLPIAVVGLPITVIGNETIERDASGLLAIPHEIGHFLFWHGVTMHSQHSGQFYHDVLAAQLRNRGVWQQNWVEEIFADIVGLLIGGPVVGYSFQDTQLAMVERLFTHDNRKHPIPAVRPFVFSETLRAIHERANRPNTVLDGPQIDLISMAEALDERWGRVLEERKLSSLFVKNIPRPLRGRVSGSSRSNSFTLDAIKNQLRSVIDVILDLLPDSWVLSQLAPIGGGPFAWTTELDVSDPYGAFMGAVNGGATPIFKSQSPTASGQPAELKNIVPTDDWWLKLAGERGYQTNGGVVPSEQWLQILHFAGWTEIGPEGPNIHGGD